jgi:hypothetical protein
MACFGVALGTLGILTFAAISAAVCLSVLPCIIIVVNVYDFENRFGAVVVVCLFGSVGILIFFICVINRVLVVVILVVILFVRLVVVVWCLFLLVVWCLLLLVVVGLPVVVLGLFLLVVAAATVLSSNHLSWLQRLYACVCCRILCSASCGCLLL